MIFQTFPVKWNNEFDVGDRIISLMHKRIGYVVENRSTVNGLVIRLLDTASPIYGFQPNDLKHDVY